ncbi:arsenate reductase (glutaredoxin) [Paenalcaligenes niemegkensis]|uniref:arsenate reductase (glutaredoxin) n=1 Tax=Paenalcaligenes niemegkensis TaxID=2895469 RepID=UPI001EE7C603|nr:arsenate reductase (glutaredoxin) [Paenalcaligenes niemegkensis]MCQ9616310.1 arsenate reductase (glutaredoxin) [Paenalcaligenes niemegkensis]
MGAWLKQGDARIRGTEALPFWSLVTIQIFNLLYREILAMAKIYHNPRCGHSRTTLELLQQAGLEVEVIEYLQHPLTKAELEVLIPQTGLSVREVLRTHESLYTELGLDDERLSDDALLEAMAENPVLMNRPIAITEKGVRLCRPAAIVEEIL